MNQQWFLCSIDRYPTREGEGLKPGDNLCNLPEFRNWIDAWLVWLPIVPRVGDTLQFPGWQVQISKVVLPTNVQSSTGVIDPAEKHQIAASLYIRDDLVSNSFASSATIDVERHQWESYARRGNDLQYYAWELRHPFFFAREKTYSFYKRWHSRIRPVVGDLITIGEQRWQVTGVELSNANSPIDGWLDLTQS